MYGAKIKIIRLARGLTQEEVARRIPVATNTYCKLEQDQRQNWPEDLVEKVAAALEVLSSDIRNPLPVLLSFGPGRPAAEACSRTAQVNEELVALLQEQLRKKDEIITSLLFLVKGAEK